MKIFKRQASLGLIAFFVSQLFFSCSTTQMQWGKTQFINNDELVVAQNQVSVNKQQMELVNHANTLVTNSVNSTAEIKGKQILIANRERKSTIELEKNNSVKLMFDKKEDFKSKVEKKPTSKFKNFGFNGIKKPMSNTMAIISFALAVISLILFFTPLSLIGLLGGIVAFVLGIVSLSTIKKNGDTGRGFAIASIVIGALILFFLLLGVLFLAAIIASL